MNTGQDWMLKQNFSNEMPFRIPKGYFEEFAEQMMGQLPVQQAKVIPMRPWWRRHRVSMFAAASICAAVFSVGIYIDSSRSQQTSLAGGSIENIDNMMDEMADYVMMDNEAIYASLTEN